MSLGLDPEDAEARVQALTDPTDDLVSLKPTGESDAAAYYLAVVAREHPDEPGHLVLMERYVQLAAEWSDMSDTWLKNGVNRRVREDDLGDFARSLAQMYLAVVSRAESGTLSDEPPRHVDGDTEA